jgi:hypothetical protein
VLFSASLTAVELPDATWHALKAISTFKLHYKLSRVGFPPATKATKNEEVGSFGRFQNEF